MLTVHGSSQREATQTPRRARMANDRIVAQRSDTEYIAPIPDRFPIHVKKVVNTPQILFSYDDIEVRHAQRMLENENEWRRGIP